MNGLTKAAVQGAACGLMIGVVLLVGGRVRSPATIAEPSPAVADLVRARGFEVVDEEGKVRASLRLGAIAYPSLILSDAAGKVRASISLEVDGAPWLMLRDTAGNTRVSLSPVKGSPGLTLSDAAGTVSWKAP